MIPAEPAAGKVAIGVPPAAASTVINPDFAQLIRLQFGDEFFRLPGPVVGARDSLLYAPAHDDECKQ